MAKLYASTIRGACTCACACDAGEALAVAKATDLLTQLRCLVPTEGCHPGLQQLCGARKWVHVAKLCRSIRAEW